jgi:hypothetical protein
MSADATTIDDLHRLVDQVPPSDLHAARRYLEYLRDRAAGLPATAEDPVLRAFTEAPLDDEALSPEDIAAIDEGQAAAAAGDVRPLEDYLGDRHLRRRRA